MPVSVCLLEPEEEVAFLLALQAPPLALQVPPLLPSALRPEVRALASARPLQQRPPALHLVPLAAPRLLVEVPGPSKSWLVVRARY